MDNIEKHGTPEVEEVEDKNLCRRGLDNSANPNINTKRLDSKDSPPNDNAIPKTELNPFFWCSHY